MGWLFRRGPLLHLNSYVREICGTYEAYEVEVAGSPTEITKENLRRGNYEHEHIEVWFLTRATKDGEPVICQMLVDFDATAKGATGLPAFDDEAGREYPHDNPTGAGVGIQGAGFRQRLWLLHLPDEISGRCADCARRARRGVESGDESSRRRASLISHISETYGDARRERVSGSANITSTEIERKSMPYLRAVSDMEYYPTQPGVPAFVASLFNYHRIPQTVRMIDTSAGEGDALRILEDSDTLRVRKPQRRAPRQGCHRDLRH